MPESNNKTGSNLKLISLMFTPSAAACNLRTVPSLDVYPSDEACSPKTVPSLGPEIKKWVTQCVYCAGFDIQFNIVVKNAVGTV